MTNMLIQRYAIGFSVGALVAVALLYMMQAVISSDDQYVEKASVPQIISFDRTIEDEDLPPPRVIPEPPPPPQVMPPEQPRERIDGPVIGKPIGPLPPKTDPHGPTGVGLLPDGDMVPYVQVRPVYPRNALVRGLEGFVLVEFCVTQNGNVRDPAVVVAEPPTMFDRSALNAVSRFKYKPRVENEMPVEVCGVQTRIVFELEDQ